MIQEDRKKEILSLIRNDGYASVGDLARALYVSEPTIRRNLTALEKEGVIRRTHGGASYVENGPDFWPLHTRSKLNLREKEYIGRLAASLLREGDHIFIDTGSTAYCFAKALDPAMRLTISTNGLPVATLLAQQNTKTVECPGGFYDPRDGAFFGEETVNFIHRRCAKFFFVSTGTMDARHGATGFDSQGMPAKHAFSRQADTTVLLMDHTKEDKVSYYCVFPWQEIDWLITDREPCESIRACCEKYGVHLMYK